MAVTRVQEKSALGNSSSATASFTTPSTSGNFLVATVVTQAGVSSSPPTGFSTIVINTNTNGPRIYLHAEENAGSITTITSSLSGSTRWTMYIAEYSGIVTSSSADAANNGTIASGSAPPSGNITTSYTNELIVAALTTSNLSTFSSPTAGFSLVDQNQTSLIASASAYLDLTAAVNAGGYSTSANTTTGGNGVIASFISTSSVIGTYVQNAIWTGSIF